MEGYDSRKISVEIQFERGENLNILGAAIQLETIDNRRNWRWIVSLENSEIMQHLLRVVNSIPDKVEISLCANPREDGDRAMALKIFHDQIVAISQILRPINPPPARHETRVFGLSRAAQRSAACQGANSTLSDVLWYLGDSLELYHDILYSTPQGEANDEETINECRFLLTMCSDVISMCQAYVYFIFPVWVLTVRYQTFEECYLNVFKLASQTKITQAYARHLASLNRILD
jgi:hypothetical protein